MGESFRLGILCESVPAPIDASRSQVCEAAEPFVSSLFARARKLVATEPLRRW